MTVEILLDSPDLRLAERVEVEALGTLLSGEASALSAWLVPSVSKQKALETQLLKRKDCGFFDEPIKPFDDWVEAWWKELGEKASKVSADWREAKLEELTAEVFPGGKISEEGLVYPGLLRHVSNAIVDRKHAGIFESKQEAHPHKEFSWIFDGYQAALLKSNQVDKEDRIRAVASACRDSQHSLAKHLSRYEKIWISGFYDFTELQFELIQALSKNVKSLTVIFPSLPVSSKTVQYFSDHWKKRFCEVFPKAKVSPCAPSPTTPRREVARSLFDASAKAGLDVDSQISLHYAPSPAQEIETMAREMARLHKQEGIAWSDMRVVFPNADSYRPFVEVLFARHGIPCYFTAGKTLSQEPHVLLKMQFLRLALDPPLMEAASFFNSSYLNSNSQVSLAGQALLEIMRNAQGATGGFKQALSEVREKENLDAGVRGLLKSWESSFPPVDVILAVDAFVDCARALLESLEASFAGPRGEKNDCDKFLQALTRLKETAETVSPPDRIWTEWLACLERNLDRVKVKEEREGAPVSGVLDYRSLNVDYLFWGGLTDASWPLPDSPDLFARGGKPLSSPDKRVEARWLSAAFLVSTQKRAYLSSPCLESGGSQLPAFYLFEIERLVDHDTLFNIPDAERDEFPSKQIQAGKVLSAKFSLKKDESSAGENSPSRCHASAIRGQAVRALRTRGSKLGCWDGVFGSNDLLEHLKQHRLGPQVWHSATALDSFANCPFAYGAKRVLRLAPYDASLDDTLPMDSGSVVHRILKIYFEKHDGDSNDEARLKAVALREFQQARPEDAFWKGEMRKYMSGLDSKTEPAGLLKQFLAYEREDKERFHMETSPKWFELPFGKFSEAVFPVDAKNLEKGVTVDTEEGTVRCRGYIDRVDTSEDGFIVYDYKTGLSVPAIARIHEGLSFQMPLYLLALKEAHVGEVLGAAFYKLGEKLGKSPWLVKKGVRKRARALEDNAFDELLETVKNRIGKIGMAMARGLFHLPVFNEEKQFCQNCDYEGLCQKNLERMEGLRHLRRLPDDSYIPDLEDAS